VVASQCTANRTRDGRQIAPFAASDLIAQQATDYGAACGAQTASLAARRDFVNRLDHATCRTPL
jgi:hypothetical protein